MAQQYLELACREVGVDCDFKAQGKTLEEIMEQCAKHATEEHGWHSFTPALWVEMRKHVKTVQQ